MTGTPHGRGRPRRPGWQRPLGLVVIFAAVVLMVVNDAGLVGAPTPLPGGHSELYFFAGIAAGCLGAGLAGVFDARGRL